jgi:hypothetical protein
MGEYSLRACGRKWWPGGGMSRKRSPCHLATLVHPDTLSPYDPVTLRLRSRFQTKRTMRKATMAMTRY